MAASASPLPAPAPYPPPSAARHGGAAPPPPDAPAHPALREGSIRRLRLRNRAVLAPMSRISAGEDGVPTRAMSDYYGRFADGGFSLIIAEGTYTDGAYSQGYGGQPGIINPAQAEGWQRVAARVQAAGARIVLQLMHAGALSQHLGQTAAPSAVQPRGRMLAGYGGGGEYLFPGAMTADDLAVARAGFVMAARRAEAAGFDGVEIHGANGYLLDQFLTGYTNQRTDGYGGGARNRVRLTAETLAEVRRAVADSFIVGVRLSQGKVNDFDYLWPDAARDAETIFRAVAEAGADYIHFATEGKGYRHGSFSSEGLCLPQAARAWTGLPVFANGGLHDAGQARRVLEAGEADFVALGTGALVNPDWPRHLSQGQNMEAWPPDYFKRGVTLDLAPPLPPPAPPTEPPVKRDPAGWS